MKLLLITALTVLGASAYAGPHENDKMSFADKKAHMLEGAEKRIAGITKHKACVEAAKDKKALKACRMDMKEHRKGMKHHHKKMKDMRKKAN